MRQNTKTARAVAHANYLEATTAPRRALSAATLAPMSRFLEATAAWAASEGIPQTIAYPEARRQRWLGILRDASVARAIDTYDAVVADAYALYATETRIAFASYVESLQRLWRGEEAA